MIPTQINTSGEDHAVMSFNQTPIHAKETTVYVDKIITIQEVTSADGGRVMGDSQVTSNFN